MRVKLQESGQFGENGPQKGALGNVVGFTHGGEYEETFFLVRFDGYNELCYVPPRLFGIYDGTGTFPVWRWLERLVGTERNG